jgi:hypothetical protein
MCYYFNYSSDRDTFQDDTGWPLTDLPAQWAGERGGATRDHSLHLGVSGSYGAVLLVSRVVVVVESLKQVDTRHNMDKKSRNSCSLSLSLVEHESRVD